MTMPLLQRDPSIDKSLITAEDNNINTIAAKPEASLPTGTTLIKSTTTTTPT
jgi:hypothetical protein